MAVLAAATIAESDMNAQELQVLRRQDRQTDADFAVY
jgi:hypothetical protein